MDRHGRSRRDYLRRVAVAGSLALCSGVAGCATEVPALDESLPWYGAWIPGGDGDGGYDPGWVASFDLERARERRRTVPDRTIDRLEAGLDAPWSPFASPGRVDRVATVGPDDGGSGTARILEGHLDAGRAVSRLADRGFEAATDYRGFDRLQGPDGSTVAIDPGAVVVVDARGSPAERIRALVDARREDRVTTGDDRTDALLSTLGEGLAATVDLGGDAPIRAGRAARIRVPSFDVVRTTYLLRDPDADLADVEAWAEDPDSAFPAMRDVEVDREGDLVGVHGRVGAERIRVDGERAHLRDGYAAPDARFAFQYIDRTLRILHDGGRAITPTNADALTYGPRGGSRQEWPFPVTEGDAVTLSAPADFAAGDAVTVVWESVRGRREELAAFQVPS